MAMPTRMAAPQAISPRLAGSPKTTAPAAAPTTGSRLTKAPAISADTLLWPYANKVNGASVPTTASPSAARAEPALRGAAGMPSEVRATGRTASAAPRNCAAVTAIGSRSRSRLPWATVNPADTSSDARISPSPPAVAPRPPPPATRATPASDTAKPAQASGRATVCCQHAVMIATSTGTAPISKAAWLTLVRVMPVFCKRTEPP
jgi:hypothetical protein